MAINLGDIIFQLFMLFFLLGIPAIFVILFIKYKRTAKQKQEQFQRMEAKVEQLEKRLDEK